MIRRPPRSPLFPYPTLSRSRNLTRPVLAGFGIGFLIFVGTGALLAYELHAGRYQTTAQQERQRAEYELRYRRYAGLDRKSTRLNSSHANISYAVFCLKKKKE